MWLDITQTLNHDIAHWPEDAPFSYEIPVTKEVSGAVNIGKITTSTHIGTHIDAPFHFDDNGATTEMLDVNRYIGDATVIEEIGADVISRELLERHDIKGTILLVKTTNFTDEKIFPNSVPTLTIEAVEYLALLGIELFGIDVPSVDDIDSKTLDIHHKLYRNDIMIIENVVLTEIDPGHYDFIALPLKIYGGDGSPVRAVIRKKESNNE